MDGSVDAPGGAPPGPPLAARIAAWIAPAAGAWWIASEGRPGPWIVAVPTVLAAAAVAGAVVPWPRRVVRLRPLLRFVGWFVEQSLRGGVEAARLALAPSMPLSPALRELTTRLPEGGARVLLAQAVSLTPGTLTVDLEGDRILLHVLDGGEGLERDVRELEERIAELVGLPPGGAA